MTDHPLKGKWLVHYYGDRPWRSISDLDETDANRIAAESGKTFDGSYYRRRLEIETWNRARHVADGGIIQNENPVYAILCDAIPERHPHHGNWIAIPAETVPAGLVSLSLGDSFIGYEIARGRMAAPDMLGRSYSPEALMETLGHRPLPLDWPSHVDSGDTPFYVEAHLYTRELPQPHATALAGIAARPAPAEKTAAADFHHATTEPGPGAIPVKAGPALTGADCGGPRL